MRRSNELLIVPFQEKYQKARHLPLAVRADGQLPIVCRLSEQSYAPANPSDTRDFPSCADIDSNLALLDIGLGEFPSVPTLTANTR